MPTMNPQEIPLRDLHLPEVAGWWPLAPGWWMLIALAFLGVFLLLRNAYRRYRWNAPRRRALKQFASIRREFENGADAVMLGKHLSGLVRRAMLAYAPRNVVAGLTGDNWLKWLDQGLEGQPFSTGAGRILETLPYMNPARTDIDTDVAGLVDAVGLRLRAPLDGGTS